VIPAFLRVLGDASTSERPSAMDTAGLEAEPGGLSAGT